MKYRCPSGPLRHEDVISRYDQKGTTTQCLFLKYGVSGALDSVLIRADETQCDPLSLSLSYTHAHAHTRTHTHTHTQMHAHTHAHTHTHTHRRTHRRTHTHTHTHARTHTHTHRHTHRRTHARTHTHAHTHTRTDARTDAHTHTHAQTHARTHAHTHTLSVSVLPVCVHDGSLHHDLGFQHLLSSFPFSFCSCCVCNHLHVRRIQTK